MLLIGTVFVFGFASAQMNRSAQAGNITSNIYQNSSHAITGSILQSVMLNQNNSYVNLLSDTNLLDIRMFSPYATYTPGMGVFHNDTLYMNVISAHGTWTSSDWVKINGSSCACSTLVKYSDTSVSVATLHDISIATNPLIAWTDTGGGTGVSAKIATPHAVSVAAATLIPFSDTGTGSKKVATSYNLTSYSTITRVQDSLQNYQQIKDSNTKAGYATVYYVGSHGGPNYLSDTSGGAGAKPVLLTKNSGWSLQGNGGTSPGTNFIGTTDNEPIEFKVGNVFSGIIDNSGGLNSVSIGNNAASNGFGATAFGTAALYPCTGSDNAAFGLQSGYHTNTGSYDLFVGDYSGFENVNGISNSASGTASLYNTTGSYNTAIGDSAGFYNSTGKYNIFIGYKSGLANTSLSNQIYLGDSSGSSVPIAVKFSGSLMPYYSSNYQAGTNGQVLVSQGSGGSPRWLTSIYSHNIVAPLNATTITLVDNEVNIINPSASLSLLTISFPPVAANNDIIFIKTTKSIATISYSGATVADGITSATAGALIMYTYDSGTSTWY